MFQNTFTSIALMAIIYAIHDFHIKCRSKKKSACYHVAKTIFLPTRPVEHWKSRNIFRNCKTGRCKSQTHFKGNVAWYLNPCQRVREPRQDRARLRKIVTKTYQVMIRYEVHNKFNNLLTVSRLCVSIYVYMCACVCVLYILMWVCI